MAQLRRWGGQLCPISLSINLKTKGVILNSYRIDKGIPLPDTYKKVNKFKSRFDKVASEMEIGDSIVLVNEHDIDTLRMALTIRGKSSMRRKFLDGKLQCWRMWVTGQLYN